MGKLCILNKEEEKLCLKFGVTSEIKIIVSPIKRSPRNNKCDREILLKCFKCRFTTANQTAFKTHSKSHTISKNFKCTLCSFATTTNSRLKDHMNRHLGRKPFSCPYDQCKMICASNSNLKSHIRMHTGEKRYECTQCNYKGGCNSNLMQHIRSHHNKNCISQQERKRISCPFCPKHFWSKTDLNSHMWRHTGEKPFFCQICKQGFASVMNKNRHEKKCNLNNPDGADKYWVFKKPTTFKCDLCAHTAKTASNLKHHSFVHTKIKEFKCTMCDRAFSLKGSLKSHMKTHTDDKPFKCPHCNWATAYKLSIPRHILYWHNSSPDTKFPCTMCRKSFATAIGLRSHELHHAKTETYPCHFCQKVFTWKPTRRLHEPHCESNPNYTKKTKPFKCPLCSFKSATKSELKIHTRTHTGDKRFSCTLCNYKCDHRNSLNIHIIRIHTGEKPFRCNECNFATPSKSHLKRHRDSDRCREQRKM